MNIVLELPCGIELSPHLREKASFYIKISSLGSDFYIAGTPQVRRLLGLDVNGGPTEFKQSRRWREESVRENGLRDIVASLELQVRDNVLAGIEENVTATLLAKMHKLMAPTVRGMIADQIPKLLTDEEAT